MLKKEIRDALRVLFESSLLLLAFPVMYLLDRYVLHIAMKTAELAQAVYMISGYIFVLYSGLALFRKERKDRGLEYLLTLPMSRFKILCCKMAPRLIVIVMIVLIHEILFSGQRLLMTDVFANRLLVAVLVLHLIAVSMSLVTSNLLLGFIGIYVLQILWVFGSRLTFDMFKHFWGYSFALYSSWTWILPGILILTPLVISFLLSYRSLDLKPEKFHIKPYLVISLPLLALQAIAIFALYQNFSSVLFK